MHKIAASLSLIFHKSVCEQLESDVTTGVDISLTSPSIKTADSFLISPFLNLASYFSVKPSGLIILINSHRGS